MIVHNEHRSIEAAVRCLLYHCDDVLVVDGNSTDGTLEKLLALCREFRNLRLVVWSQNSSRYHSAWNEPLRRNWAIKACLNDWILTLDGDELLSDLPANYFREIETPLYFDRYNLLNRREVIIHYQSPEKLETWYPDHQVRYFNRMEVHYTDHALHCYLVDRDQAPIRHRAEHSNALIFHYHALVNPDRKWDNSQKRNLLQLDILKAPLPALDSLIIAQAQ
jgi:glycosyltransferase involved in cell wall biosynthesis